MDTCFSILQQPFSGPSPHTCDMELLAYAYARYRRLMDHWRAWRADAFLTVRYEDLVEDPLEVGRRLFDYCGLEWRAEYLDPARREGPVRTFSATQVRQPIHATSIGAWRQFADLLAPLRDALTRELG